MSHSGTESAGAFGTLQAADRQPPAKADRGSPSVRVPGKPAAMRPLCVDLDGTLVFTDTLWECLIAAAARHPLRLLLIPLWLLRGRAHLKRRLAELAQLDVSVLPYNEDLIGFLAEQQRAGRTLILATAADARIAGDVAAHLGLFSGVFASDGRANLSAGNKLAALQRAYGAKNFDYIGNHRADLAIWPHAGEALVVGHHQGVLRLARQTSTVSRTFPTVSGRLNALLRSLRPEQWMKNLLVFVPLATSHTVVDPAFLWRGLLAFLAFSAIASAGYLINDLTDLDADRRHRSKRSRPLAAGDLPINTGLAAIPALLGIATLLVLPLGPEFALVLAVYFVISVSYSAWLKRLVLIDVIVLASLYTTRIFAGGTAIAVEISSWLLTFAMFVFLSLALVKRFSELRRAAPDQESLHRRGYAAPDLAFVMSMGASCGFISVLVFGLYVSSDAASLLYDRPHLLWFICPLVFYWIARVWLLAHRGEMNEDPVVFATRDPASYGLALLAGAIILGAA